MFEEVKNLPRLFDTILSENTEYWKFAGLCLVLQHNISVLIGYIVQLYC